MLLDGPDDDAPPYTMILLLILAADCPDRKTGEGPVIGDWTSL